MTTVEIPRPQEKDQSMNRIDIAGNAYRKAAERLVASGSSVPLAQLILQDMKFGRRDIEPVPGELPRTQASIDLMRSSAESTIGMDYSDPRRYGILAACRTATEVIENDGNCVMNADRSGEQCLRYGAALLAMQETMTSVTIK